MDKIQKVINLYIDLMKGVLTGSIYEDQSWDVEHTNDEIVIKAVSFNKSKREEGRDWPFLGYTMVGHRRLENVQMCVEDVLRNEIPGDFMETGVWRGGATIFMRALLKAYHVTNRKVWVADSFEGLPAPKNKDDGWDLSHVDHLKVSLENVKSNFEKFGLLDKQVEFLKGWFSDTLPNASVKNLAILRLDGDMYSSTMDALQNLYHKVSKGGYVIIDDYYAWPACRQAVTDYLERHSITPEIIKIDWAGAYWKV